MTRRFEVHRRENGAVPNICIKHVESLEEARVIATKWALASGYNLVELLPWDYAAAVAAPNVVFLRHICRNGILGRVPHGSRIATGALSASMKLRGVPISRACVEGRALARSRRHGRAALDPQDNRRLLVSSRRREAEPGVARLRM